MPLSFKLYSPIKLDDLRRLQTDRVPKGLRIGVPHAVARC